MTYLPEHFAQNDQAEIERFLAAHQFATIVGLIDHQLFPTHLPLIHKPSPDGHGSFIGHVASANDMWRAGEDIDVLVIVNGPNAYITPNWYPTKAETHEVVPTWSYAAVHAWGKMTVHRDAKWKRMAVGLLTRIHESQNEVPWKMGDAPQPFLEEQLDHIVGIEISIDRLIAKYKLNQNRSLVDREGVVSGLKQRDSEDDASIRKMMIDTIGPPESIDQ